MLFYSIMLYENDSFIYKPNLYRQKSYLGVKIHPFYIWSYDIWIFRSNDKIVSWITNDE